MKRCKAFILAISSLPVFMSCTSDSIPMPEHKDISQFLGQWVIDDSQGGVSWLEVRQADGYVDADLLWRSGSVLPVSDVYLAENSYLVVTRTGGTILERDENNMPVRSHMVTRWLELFADGEKISGYDLQPRRNGTGVDTLSVTGSKLAPVPDAPDLSSITYGDPIELFNGIDLAGWRLIDTSLTNGFEAVDGTLVNNPVQPEEGTRIRYGNIRTDQVFEDFNLKLEVNVPEGSNSGIYLRGMYEVQILDSYGSSLDPHNMGALYSRITPSESAEKPGGTWQSLDITLVDRHLTVILNGVKIIDNKPVYGPTGGAISSDVFAPGPIYLQGDHGRVSFRNMVLTPVVDQ